MKFKSWRSLIVWIAILLGGREAAAASGIDTLADRVTQNLWEDHVYSVLVEQYIKLQGPDGLFTDINYSTTSITNWQPVAHSTRILMWAKAYTNPICPYRGADTMRNKIVMGMEAYLKQNPVSRNWWYNDVGEDLPWGQILILMRGHLDDTTLQRWAQRITGRWMGYTGANLLWEGGAHIYKCIILNQPSGIDSVMQHFRADIQFVDEGDGIHRDYSFGQHSTRRHFPYNGGYGQNYLDEAIDWVRITEGTRYAFAGDARAQLDSLILHGSAWMIHKNRWDPTMLGRTITRIGTPWADPLRANAATLMGKDSGGELDTLQKYLRNQIPWFQEPDKLFWTCGYLAHHGPGWMTSVRAPRGDETATESGNGEGLFDWYLAYGSNWTQVRGGEYDSIWPVLDWSSIPGVTNDHPDTMQGVGPKNGFGYNYGTTDFVGGVSDGYAAAFGYDYYVSEIRGKKAWFQTPDALVAIGSGFIFDVADPVTTTVDQKWLRTPVRLVDRKGLDVTMGTDSVVTRDILWAHQDSVGYWFPYPDTLEVKSAYRQGSWRTINTQNPNALVTGNVFQMRILQGTAQVDGRFGYVIVPGVSADSMANWIRKNPIEIAKNTPKSQAVSEGHWKGLVFHSPDTVEFEDGTAVAVDKPCALTITTTTEGSRYRAASPDRDYGPLRLSVRSYGSWGHYDLWLPERSLLGSPIEVYGSNLVGSSGCASQRRSYQVRWRGPRATLLDIGVNRHARLVSVDGRLHGRWNELQPGTVIERAVPGMWLVYTDDAGCDCKLRIPPRGF